MNPATFSFFIALLLLITGAKASAQWLPLIQTESDWGTLYGEGYFDMSSYQIYRELAEGAIVKDTMEYIEAALGNSAIDIGQSIAHNDIISSSGASRISSTAWPKIFIKTGQEILSTADKGYLAFRSLWQGFSIDFKGRHSGQEWTLERRALKFGGESYSVTAGNYTADFGSGLGIGRYDYRPLSRSGDASSDILYPDNSYYNGFLINYRDKLSLLFSAKNYDSISKRFFGGAIITGVADFNMGATFGTTSLYTTGYGRFLNVASIFISDPEHGISAEAAYAEAGAGLFFKLKRGPSQLKTWYYHNSFTNLQSSATANPDYGVFHDDRFDISFRQPQAGETGFSVQHGHPFGRVNLFGSTEIWRQNPRNSLGIDNSMGAKMAITDFMNLQAIYTRKFSEATEKSTALFSLDIKRDMEISILTLCRFAGSEIDNAKSLSQIFIRMPLRDNFSVGGRLRWRFAGRFEYFLEEKTVLNDKIYLKITYKKQELPDNRLGSLYLLAECAI